jgi:cell division septum initiation protein DivIVA
MIDLEQKITRLEVEVSALKEKVSFFSVIYTKIDKDIENLTKMLEERRNDTNKDLKDVYTKIENTENKIMEEISKLRDEMRRNHEEEKRKIDDLTKWRFFVVGAATIAAALISWFASKIGVEVN